MKLWVRRLTLTLAAACVVLLSASFARASSYDWVRVRLTVDNATSLSLSVSGSYFIDKNGASFAGGTLSIRVNMDGTLTVSHSSMGDIFTGTSFSIMRENVSRTAGYLRLNSRNYLGHFAVKLTNSGYIQIVNHVPLAHYLYGVVGHEMSDTWPIEALKSQALAAKNYALTCQNSYSDYDLGDTSSDQVYKGYTSSNSNVINAVDSTLNQFLTIGGKIFRTYYAASNGGETKLVTQAWSDRGTDAGYAVSIDDYDFANTIAYKETAFFPLNGSSAIPARVESFLKNKASTALGMSVSSVNSITSAEAHSPRYGNVTRDMTRATVSMVVTAGGTVSGGTDGSGGGFGGFGGGGGEYVEPTVIGGEPQAVTITFSLSELLTGGVFSNSSLRTYWGEAVAGGYNIYHVRWGHGVGLSQRGAQQRANAGHSYTQILSFYYPGASISTIAVAQPQNPTKPENSGSVQQTYPAVGKTTSSVNFRSGPSVAYNIHEMLAKGVDIILYSYSDGWYQAYYNGKTGYLSADYVTWVRAAQSSDLPSGAPEASPTQSPTVTDPGALATGVVTGSGVNFREGPSTSTKSLTKLAKETQLVLYQKSGEWYHASTGSLTGYIHANYVRQTGFVTQPEQPSPSPTQTPAPGSTNDPITGMPTKTVKYWTGYVTGQGVKFRDKPNTATGAILYSLAKNTELVLFDTSSEWYSARYGTVDGYISGKYVTITGEHVGEFYDETKAPGTGGTNTGGSGAATIGIGETTGNVNFRTGPSTSHQKITQLKPGAKLTLYALDNGWYEADYNTTYGFISAKYVKVISTSSTGSTGGQAQNATGVTSATVNFRDYPSTTAGMVYEKLSKGVNVTILGQNSEWYYVKIGSREGYLYKAYVRVTSAGTAGIPTFDLTPPLVIPTPTPTIKPSSSPGVSPTPNTSPAASPSPSPSPGSGQPSGIVTEQTYLRNYPGTQGDVVSTVERGVILSVYAVEGSWYLVGANGVLGYINSSCVILY